MPPARAHIRRKSSAVSGSGPITLPPELLAEAAQRLGWAALIYAGMYALSYIGPHVALGRSDVDGRADISSLGCVGYWLLTGHPLFAADTPLATALAHVHDAPVPPSQRCEIEIPASLDAVILSCLAKDPADRPQTAAILAGALAEVPVTPWTADDAQTWWALHGPQGMASAVVDPDRSPAAIVYAER